MRNTGGKRFDIYWYTKLEHADYGKGSKLVQSILHLERLLFFEIYYKYLL